MFIKEIFATVKVLPKLSIFKQNIIMLTINQYPLNTPSNKLIFIQFSNFQVNPVFTCESNEHEKSSTIRYIW